MNQEQAHYTGSKTIFIEGQGEAYIEDINSPVKFNDIVNKVSRREAESVPGFVYSNGALIIGSSGDLHHSEIKQVIETDDNMTKTEEVLFVDIDYELGVLQLNLVINPFYSNSDTPAKARAYTKQLVSQFSNFTRGIRYISCDLYDSNGEAINISGTPDEVREKRIKV